MLTREEMLKDLIKIRDTKFSQASRPAALNQIIDYLQGKHLFLDGKSMGHKVDGDTVGIWDGFVTIWAGYGEGTRILKFCKVAIGDDRDKFVSLNDCRKMFDEKYPDHGGVLHVMFEDFTYGEFYTQGNSSDGAWHFAGRTMGFA